MRNTARLGALLTTLLVVAVPGAPAAAQERVAGPQLPTLRLAQAPVEPRPGDRLGSGLTVAPAAPDLPTGLSATTWLVADLDSGAVLAAKDAHARLAPASTLKTLTALTLIPLLPPDQRVVPTWDDVAVEGSKVGLVEKAAYPVSELFTALMAVSGNDAANALATAAGGQAETARLMNAEARRIGALDTVAVNPHGLDAEGQVSSAYDLALIARAGMADPDFAAYAGARRGTLSAPPGKAEIDMFTKNKLLQSYDGALGIKNGYTSRARASFVGAAERDGRRLVVTVMRGEPAVWEDAASLLDWGFDALAAGTPPIGQLAEPVEVSGTGQAAGGTAGGQSVGTTLLAADGSDAVVVQESGRSTPLTVAGVLVLLLTALVGRRRQVVQARQRRRREARARAAALGRAPAQRRPAERRPRTRIDAGPAPLRAEQGRLRTRPSVRPQADLYRTGGRSSSPLEAPDERYAPPPVVAPTAGAHVDDLWREHTGPWAELDADDEPALHEYWTPSLRRTGSG